MTDLELELGTSHSCLVACLDVLVSLWSAIVYGADLNEASPCPLCVLHHENFGADHSGIQGPNVDFPSV